MKEKLDTPTSRERLLLIVVAAFVVAGGVTLHLTHPPFTLGHLARVIFSFTLSFAAAHATLSRHLPERDPLLLPTAALLSGWGLLMVGRLAPNFLPRQATWLLLATSAMLVALEAGQGLRWLRRYRYTWLVAGLALLAATLILGVNPSGSGPRLWLGLGGAYFQPSEPLKLLMVVFLASYLAEQRELLVSEGHKIGPLRLPPLAYAGPLLAMFGLAALLLAAQQDLGAAMLFFFTFLTMLYLATGQIGYVIVGVVLFATTGVAGYFGSARVALRINGWLDPWAGAADRAFQIVQSLLAFGTGGILGEGLGLGRPTYIPAVHTDFVFAAIGEAFGLAGLLVVVSLYAVLLLRGLRVAVRASRPFERFLSAGLTAGLIIQAWVIMAANVRLGPIAGVTLPFLSYGGSSLLSTFIALGLLIRVSGETGRCNTNLPTYQSTNLPTYQSTDTPIYRTACALSLALTLLAGACGYWTVARADWLVAREDNPRRVAYEERIVRGNILDRDGEPLAGVRVGPSGVVTRTYPAPAAAPVVGYASLRYGTGGIEAAFDETLRGEASRTAWEAAWDDLLHRFPQGQDVQLTLDADLQQMAQTALTRTGKAGAVVLLNVESGELLAMGSAPTFDPAQLDEKWDQPCGDVPQPSALRPVRSEYRVLGRCTLWLRPTGLTAVRPYSPWSLGPRTRGTVPEDQGDSPLREDPAAPLVNRATQGLYQPGAALQTVIVAEALTQDLVEDLSSRTVSKITETLRINDAQIGCSMPPSEPGTLASAYAAACPAPIAALGERLGRDGLTGAVERWRLTTPPPLEIPTEAADWSGEALSTTAALRSEAIGQGQLTASPLQMALVVAALGNEGTKPASRLALHIADEEREWQKTPAVGAPHEIISPAEAEEILAAWKQYEHNVIGYEGSAIAGEDKRHAWFLGLKRTPGESPLAVAVLIERAANPETAREVGVTLLNAAEAN